MGSLIFFFNDFALNQIPMSLICLAIHIIYMLVLIKINPYKLSLKIHTFSLFANQSLYLVFLLFINLINLTESIDDYYILILGYTVVGFVYSAILLAVVRFYYEIKYGEGL
jgi:hypothetical protein